MKSNIFFNAHHSPLGAFASFTLGCKGAKGGLGIELTGPADESIFVGLETRGGGKYELLPFFNGGDDESKRYDVAADGKKKEAILQTFGHEKIERDFNVSSDTWSAGDLTFAIYSPAKSAPDPRKGSREQFMEAYVPAVFAEITVDNTKSKKDRRFFFGYQGLPHHHNMRRFDDLSKGRYSGIGQGLRTAIVSDSPGVTSALGFTAENCLYPEHPDNVMFGLGWVGILQGSVPAGKKKSFRFAICFYHGGTVTSGMPCSYFYTRFFKNIESVAEYALKNWDKQVKLAIASDKKVSSSRLHDSQKFMLSHAVRSYYGSTEFLDNEGTPFWVVNEGEYRMLNTFDLTVDHVFFEVRQNPWVVRDQLDWFVKRFSYVDQVILPDGDKRYPGGISFTHDMGIGNCISRPEYSSYELRGLKGCFSHMTHEQLVNWVLCGVTYIKGSGDQSWFKANKKIFLDCLKSLVNRDHPDPKKRDGVMSADSSRCDGGWEITTYDSLDASLGQARNNLYLAVKTWAAYIGLREILKSTDAKASRLAHQQAHLAAKTIASHMTDEGYIPAVMGENNQSRIIPAIEGLVFPYEWGFKGAVSEKGEFGELISILKRHYKTVLVKGACLFPNGGWKLSSTNDNSWLSKVYLCQYVARAVLGFKTEKTADDVHRDWLLHPENIYFAWSDQMVNGVARGSKYYPRGVTSWLWLDEKLK